MKCLKINKISFDFAALPTSDMIEEIDLIADKGRDVVSNQTDKIMVDSLNLANSHS